MKLKVKIEGLKQCDEALKDLPKATRKNVLKRVLFAIGTPIAEAFAASVRVAKGKLKKGIGVGTRLTTRQRREHKKAFASDKASVEVFVGAPGLVQAITEEFGTVDQAPHPGLRPAWDAARPTLVDKLKKMLWDEIEKAMKRHIAKAKRLAGKKS
ncbi:hypothetical protein IZ6_07750 [Terrihabitans soli]|uniref:HK97 gp10 family phage protein n=1 Tax=Terrihabitans soli TaxID=708113 RepID=A0A6S6QSX3_9HYPH|nr:HK97 gp10 family phage protein [Terrihabitans soli]BCJ90040.1 hypothetical protein IZ6_07750 [Terrihabitans soli]